MKKYSLVTVNYNNYGYTKKMIESLKGSMMYIDSIVIVDNDSESFDYNALVKYVDGLEVENITIIKSEENIGYFPGLNLGINKLSMNKSTYTIACNNDLEFNEDFFHKLESMTLDSNVFAVCPSVRTVDGVYQNPSLSKKPNLLRKLFYKLYFSNYFLGLLVLKIWRFMGFGKNSVLEKDNVSRPIFLGIGAIYVLTPEFFKVYTNFIYPSFLYSEEVFLSRQIEDAGGVQLYCPEIEVIHAESVTTSKLSSKVKYEMTRKSFNLCEKYYDK